MQIFHSSRQKSHSPVREFHNGDWTDFAEVPRRIDAMLAALGDTIEPDDHGRWPLIAVHDPAYVDFLATAHDEWLASGRSGDALGYAFPVARRHALNLNRIDAKLGRFGFDVATPIAAGTWEATYWSAQAALSAAQALIDGDARRSFALTRPPGHHAGADYYGGYCYLNAAAIAAQHLRSVTGKRVAILDVDYHHGNGTQDIFYERGDVFFTSIHADPAMDYPFFWGHADERGEGDGKGATLNLPLARGITWPDYERALGQALQAIAAWGAEVLVVSYGADTHEDDPISYFQLTTQDMRRMGTAIAAARLPTVGIMEGGYAVDVLGANVSAFVEGLDAG